MGGNRDAKGSVMSFVTFENVAKVYRMGQVEVRALDGMSFGIEKGELTVVVGPSGAGKTTVLNILGGIDTSTSGIVRVGDQRIDQMNERQLTQYRRHNVGFVFQFYNLMPNLTALENVELASQICDDPMDASEALDLVGLSHRHDNFPGQLSGGEQQRVAIARAIAKNPDLLLCDEPTGALDYETGKTVMQLLQKESTERGRTVVIITHNQAFCPIADRVISVHGGKAVEETVNSHPASASTLVW